MTVPLPKDTLHANFKKSSGEGHGEGSNDCKETEAQKTRREWPAVVTPNLDGNHLDISMLETWLSVAEHPVFTQVLLRTTKDVRQALKNHHERRRRLSLACRSFDCGRLGRLLMDVTPSRIESSPRQFESFASSRLPVIKAA